MKQIFVMLALMTGAVSAFAQNAGDSTATVTNGVTLTEADPKGLVSFLYRVS